MPIRALNMLAVMCRVGAAQEEPRRTGQMQMFTAAASGWLRIKCGVPWTAKAQTPFDSKDTSLMLCLSSTKRCLIQQGEGVTAETSGKDSAVKIKMPL